MEIPNEKILLKYEFSAKELSELGVQMAEGNRELIKLGDELAAIKKEYGAQQKRIQSEIDLLSEHITNGFKMERVECVRVVDHANKKIKYFTLDQDPEKDDPVKEKEIQNGHQFKAL